MLSKEFVSLVSGASALFIAAPCLATNTTENIYQISNDQLTDDLAIGNNQVQQFQNIEPEQLPPNFSSHRVDEQAFSHYPIPLVGSDEKEGEVLCSPKLTVCEHIDIPEELAQAIPEAQPTPQTITDKVTSVSQLSDVQPTDWAFVALQSLVERYGVIAGYPDGTFRGNRSMTRYEFAAGLNAALDKINELIVAGATEKVRKEDLETLQKLQAEFASELANVRAKVDNLEARTAMIEAQQFSTTAVLGGEVILAASTASGGKPPGRGETNTVLTHLTQLQILSSFTGKDVLRMSLATGNFANDGFSNFRALNTNMALLSYQADLDNDIQLNSLEYRFATFGDRVVFTLKPVGFDLSSVLSLNAPYSDSGRGALSRFGGGNPVFKIGNLDTGAGFDWLVSNRWRFQVAYGTRNGNDSSEGISGSDHSAIATQLLFKPSSNFITGLAYVNAYSSDGRLDTFTGSNNADISGGFNEPSRIHALSTSLQWQLSPQINLAASGGLMLTDSLKSDALALSTTYKVALGINDIFGREGDVLAFIFGQPPKLTAGYLIEDIDDGNSLHYEVFYRFRVNDRIAITPGFFIVTDPGHITENNDIFVGAVRTTFSF